MQTNDKEIFFTRLTESIQQQQFTKLTLSDRRDKAKDLKNVFVKPVMLKQGLRLSFVYRYPTKDITKNYDLPDAQILLEAMLEKDFFKADLFTTVSDHHFSIDKSGKTILKQKAPTQSEPVAAEHDHAKKRYVDAAHNIYLYELGITTAEGKVKSDKQDKYRQINKYAEIVESIVKDAALPAAFQITDMGAGKGYLTFALYDYLTNTMKLQPQVTGVEMRPALVDICNKIAAKAGFARLNFIAGSIDTAELPATDMLIALHACDTATDQAIYRGITGGAKVIICAPCCHKQIRKQLQPVNDLKASTKFGILEERQAEIVTDTIRALILEAFGYKTKVFEFISTEHTAKNLLITAIKTTSPPTPLQEERGVTANTASGAKQEALEKIKNLKTLFGIEYHELEKLMEIL